MAGLSRVFGAFGSQWCVHRHLAEVVGQKQAMARIDSPLAVFNLKARLWPARS